MGSMPFQDAAVICVNGHLVNDSFHRVARKNSEFCPRCGERTISACEQCHTPIPGDLHNSAEDEFVFYGGPSMYEQPAYCRGCGKPFPWTVTALAAAKDYASELEGLSEDERRVLSESLDDLVTEGPRTAVAASRFRRLAAKAGASAIEGFRSIMVDVVSEAVRKQMFGG